MSNTAQRIAERLAHAKTRVLGKEGTETLMLVNPMIMVIMNGQQYQLSEDAVKIVEQVVTQVVKKALVQEDTQITLTDQLTGKRDRFMFRWDETVVKAE